MFTTIRFSRFLRAARAILLPAALLAAASAAATAKDYLQQKADQKALKSISPSEFSAIVRNGFRGQDDQRKFEDYYKKGVFPLWTDPGNYALKGKGLKTPRRRLLDDFKAAENETVYRELNRLALDQMKQFVKGDYHPATRYNAMLLIGDLNARRPALDRPEPLPEALTTLLSSAQDASLPDAVRLAAMLGVMRHREFGASDETSRRKIGELMLAVASTKAPPAGQSAEGHAWFRRLAIRTLGDLGSPGANGAVAKALADVVADSDASPAVRCEAADALGRLKLAPASGVDPAAVGKSLDEGLFVAVAKKEIRQGQEDKTYVVNARELKVRLAAILTAVAGNSASASKGLLGLVTKPDEGQSLRTLRKDLESLLGKEFLDNEALAPKKKQGTNDPMGPAGGPGGGGLMNPGAMGADEGLGAPGGMGGPAGPVAPDKAVSDRILAELTRLVEQREKRASGP